MVLSDYSKANMWLILVFAVAIRNNLHRNTAETNTNQKSNSIAVIAQGEGEYPPPTYDEKIE